MALNEIARVGEQLLNLAGALSDHARQEIEAISPENSTLNQILAVTEVLKSDMKNLDRLDR